MCFACVPCAFAQLMLLRLSKTHRQRSDTETRTLGAKDYPSKAQEVLPREEKQRRWHARLILFLFFSCGPVARIGVDVIKRGRDGKGEHLRVHKMLCTTINAALSTGASKMNQKQGTQEARGAGGGGKCPPQQNILTQNRTFSVAVDTSAKWAKRAPNGLR